jgi:hypothetical protein
MPGRKRKELGPCGCSGPLRRTDEWDAEETTVTDWELVREISRGEPGPWFTTTEVLGPEEIVVRIRYIPYQGVWRGTEVTWSAVIKETDDCQAAAWTGGPSLGMEGFGSPFCVWTAVAWVFSDIRIISKRTVEKTFSGLIIETQFRRQTKIPVQSVGTPTLPGVGGISFKATIEYEPVTIASETVYVGPEANTPQPVVNELHK